MKPYASISLDADNLWSYLKTRGDQSWESRPSYLPVLADRLLELWDRLGVQGTVFVVGHDAAQPDGAQLVRSLHEAGHEIANHSYEHEPWLHRYPLDQLTSDIARTEEAIVAAGAPRPRGFRGPGYSLSPELVNLLAERGYRYDCSTLPTWIGPLARAYYFRSTQLNADEQEERSLLFGRASEVKRPNRPYLWQSNPDVLELPVTTMPFFRVPIHLSYLITAHQINPRLAGVYERMALRLCRLSGTQPSILMHPLDLIDTADAPGLEFFPAAEFPAARKTAIAERLIRRLQESFTLVGTGVHAEKLRAGRLSHKDPASLAVSP